MLLAPMLLQGFLLLLALPLVLSLHYDVAAMSLLLLVLPSPMLEKSSSR
jgi:hypothetical protein